MKLNIFTSTTKDGIMSKDKIFFPTMGAEERSSLYENTLNRFFTKINIDYRKVIFLSDKNNNTLSRIVTRKTKKVKEGIVILKSTIPNLLVAVETIDDPIIVASLNLKDNENVSAIALGTIENINNNIIHEIIESLIRETGAAPFEMTFYIGACPSKENYILKNISQLTNNYLWKGAIEKKDKIYYLDLRLAIFNQLISEIVDPNYIYFDQNDTTTDSNYFSKFSNKDGKNLVCVVYTNEEV